MNRPYAIDKTKFLDDAEYNQLSATLERNESKDKRNVALIRLLLATGGRASEILALTKADLTTPSRSVLIRGLKGSSDRELPLHQKLFNQIQQLPGERLFPISYSRLVQIWHLYRPVAKKLHSTRHTFAVRLYRRTRDIRLLQTALGHRAISNTLVYLTYEFNTKELRRIL